DLSAYGLDKPYLRVAVTSGGKKEAAEQAKAKEKAEGKAKADGAKAEKAEAKERVLLVGKPAEAKGKDDKGGKGRYAKLGEGEGGSGRGARGVGALDRGALPLPAPPWRRRDREAIARTRTRGVSGSFPLQHEKDAWRVPDARGAPSPADGTAVEGTLRA